MDLLGDTLVVAVVCDVIEVGSSSVVLDIYIFILTLGWHVVLYLQHICLFWLLCVFAVRISSN